MPGLHEDAARTRKAWKLVDVLTAHGATALEAAQLPEEGWEALAQLAGTRPASPATRAVAVTLLEAKEAAQLRCPPDPWAGL